VLFAEPTILVHFKSVRVILLIFHCVVISLLTFCASECDFHSHDGTSRFTEFCLVFFKFLVFEKAISLPHTFCHIQPVYPTFWARRDKHIQYAAKVLEQGSFCKKKEPTEVE